MKSLSRISSHIRYGVSRAKKLEPRVFISSIDIQWICRHAAAGSRIAALRPLILSAFALIVLWYIYGILFGTSQPRTIHPIQDYTLFYGALKSSSSSNTPVKSSPKPLQRTTATVREGHGTIPINDNSDNTEYLSDVTKKPFCDIPTGLGRISANMHDIAIGEVEKKYSEVQWGGWYSPPDCTARHSVAIIVPYRDRKLNLAIFLNHMHPFLAKQRIEYGIFIVEQKGIHEFNRGKLLNVGFVESLKHRDWQCFIFHDIDLLPLDQRNFYSCPHPQHPRLLDANAANRASEVFGKGKTVKRVFGGVSALTRNQFTRANGYSNGFWGWGGEDDDLYYRLTELEYTISQYDWSIARYAALKHRQKSPSPARYRLLLQTVKSFENDGLNTLNYQLISVTLHHLYTHILVNVDQSYHDLQELLHEQEYLEFGPQGSIKKYKLH